MPHDLPKAYDPTAIEDKWAEYWVSENLFTQPTPNPDEPQQGEPFTILLPPPNVTGRLHMGHMLNQTEMDILTRWRRMSGRRALWLPGTDHAGIATQMMVERQLVEEGTSRQNLGREAFVARVWEWRRHYGGAILSQMKRLGASVDWKREYFTMDDNLSVAVREAFVRLYEQGLIYRGAYIVNWCPRCQTAISDVEVVHQEQKGHLWEIRYSVLDDDGQDSGEYITVATTRPETMLGDTAVAVHPGDERYMHLHGKKLRLPLVGREIPIILDTWVSRDFGTGAVKVTPAHDPNDFALGQRHNLPNINIMDETAHINDEGGVYAGLDRYVARKRIIADLEVQGLLAGVKDHTSSVGHCDRCKTVVEPRLSTQWFVKIQPLADKAIAAVKDGHIQFTPEMYKKTYLNWMENIYDWCISRQLWWGHRIPAWHCATCSKITVARVDPTNCAHCGSEQITQETDVLDTWFSSGLLPVSVFGWPNFTGVTNPPIPNDDCHPEQAPNDDCHPERAPNDDCHPERAQRVEGPASSTSNLGAREGKQDRADFNAFYPTSLLVTGFDILFFWVARMIMLGIWFAQDVPEEDGSPRSLANSVPFREVYIHALVRDANREKMSKTKGNVIDPIEVVKTYGTDAVRFTLASMASPGTDIAFNIARTEGYRAFANKIWNAARFIFQNVDSAADVGIVVDPAALGTLPQIDDDAPLPDQWIVDGFQAITRKVHDSLEAYRYDEAANFIYQFFWGSFCDAYIEIAKARLDFSESADRAQAAATLTTLVSVFEAALRQLSPFMPFITEELWQQLYEGNAPTPSIALAEYPFAELNQLEVSYEQKELWIRQIDRLLALKSELLSLRKEIGVEEKASVPIILGCAPLLKQAIEGNLDWFARMSKISEIRYDQTAGDSHPELKWRYGSDFGVAVIYERTIDIPAERERHTKDIAKYEKGLAAAERQLGNEAFIQKAPPQVVEGLKKQEAETRLLLEKARAALEALPPPDEQA